MSQKDRIGSGTAFYYIMPCPYQKCRMVDFLRAIKFNGKPSKVIVIARPVRLINF
ncbi:MAG TPA: hypothetical protein VJJ80_00455 [Patescibacteria group bacterium]|nr:hypothetical protein [Patescibacteria group bacterium]